MPSIGLRGHAPGKTHSHTYITTCIYVCIYICNPLSPFSVAFVHMTGLNSPGAHTKLDLSL